MPSQSRRPPDGDDVPAGDEGDGFAVADAEHVQAVAACYVVDVAGAPGGQEHDPFALSLEERVESHCGAVHEGLDPGRVVDHETQGVHHPSGQVVAPARGLAGGVLSEIRVVRHHVGEGAADVGCYPELQVRFQQATRCPAPMSTSSWGVSGTRPRRSGTFCRGDNPGPGPGRRAARRPGRHGRYCGRDRDGAKP